MIPYRIWRSPYTRFGGLNSICPDDTQDETITALHAYKEEDFRAIADNGFNAIWVHGVMASLVSTGDFPEFGKNAEAHYKNMNLLIERAAAYGLKVFLYCQPVRSVAAENTLFWKNHSDCMGQKEVATEQIIPERMDEFIDMYCLCTSTEKVKNFVRDGAALLAEKMPRLGGLILITASEYPGHCYSHRCKENPTEWKPLIACPRCKEREPGDIVAELISLMYEGIRKHSQTMDIIAWNWGWSGYLKAPCIPLLEKLPKEVIIMCGCEQGGTMELAERPHHPVNEYSLIYGGPSPHCREVLAAAEKLGMPTMTKLQLGATHELANIVSFPIITKIYEKASWHRAHPDSGYMGCWNVGNFYSLNTFAFNYFLREDCPKDKEEALNALAEEYFPNCNAGKVVNAWYAFEKAVYYFPFAIPFLYRGPQTCSLAYWEIFKMEKLSGNPFGCSYLPKADRGDDLSGSFTMAPHEFSLNELISHLGKMAVLWDSGVEILREGLENCNDRNELGNAIIAGSVWQSTENIYRMYRLRQNWQNSPVERGEFLHILQSEISAVKTALPWVEKDPRQGWHGEAFVRLFDEEGMEKKLRYLQEILTEKF